MANLLLEGRAVSPLAGERDTHMATWKWTIGKKKENTAWQQMNNSVLKFISNSILVAIVFNFENPTFLG